MKVLHFQNTSLILKPLPVKFYLRDCRIVANDLIGKVLVRKKNRRLYAGIIVETEAYLGSRDPAAHSFRGMTKRNEAMFSEGGVAYVYFIYGNHYCFNVVVDKKNIAHAVLVRAVEPVAGIEYMKINRRTDDLCNLTNGPGKITQAFDIDLGSNGVSLQSDQLFISGAAAVSKPKVERSKRIGITKNEDMLYRFFAKDNVFVSKFRN